MGGETEGIVTGDVTGAHFGCDKFPFDSVCCLPRYLANEQLANLACRLNGTNEGVFSSLEFVAKSKKRHTERPDKRMWGMS